MRSRGGFTLVEAIIALTISAGLVMLVSTVFQVQNQFYALQLRRSTAHENARVATETVSRELRSVVQGAFVVAQDSQLVVRSPIALAAVCARPTPSLVAVHVDGGFTLDPGEISGFAVRDSVTGGWSYHDGAGWASIYAPGGSPAADCAQNGADTTGVVPEFLDLQQLASYHGTLPAVGDLLMLYRRLELRFGTSAIDPTSVGLFRGIQGGMLVEVATGMDTTARFLYRTGGTTYAASVTGAGLGAIDAVRVVAEARQPAETGGQDEILFGWSVNVHLRNGG